MYALSPEVERRYRPKRYYQVLCPDVAFGTLSRDLHKPILGLALMQSRNPIAHDENSVAMFINFDALFPSLIAFPSSWSSATSLTSSWLQCLKCTELPNGLCTVLVLGRGTYRRGVDEGSSSSLASVGFDDLENVDEEHHLVNPPSSLSSVFRPHFRCMFS